MPILCLYSYKQIYETIVCTKQMSLTCRNENVDNKINDVIDDISHERLIPEMYSFPNLIPNNM